MDGKTSDWRPGPSVCRCCLAEGCYKDISTEYFWMGKREVYADMLSDTFSVSIAYSSAGGPNSHSRLICEPCISRLRDAADFKRQVQECERTFMQHLDPGSTSAANDIDIEAQPAGKEVKLEQVKLEKRFSDDDFDTADFGDEDDDDMDDQPLTKFATKVPKKEAVDFLDLIDNSQITVKRMSMSKSKAPPAKKVKVTKKEPAKPTASKAPIKVVKEKKKKEEMQLSIVEEREATPLTIARKNAGVIMAHATAYPFRLPDACIMCIFCGKEYANSSHFRQHMEADHADFRVKSVFLHCTNGYIKADCTDLRCKLCSDTYSTLKAMAHHLCDVHKKNLFLAGDLGIQPYKFSEEKFLCGICDSNFPGLRQLSRHMSSHFKNFTCEECGKCFTTKNILQGHLRLSHYKEDRICRKCKQTFSSLEAKREHVVSTSDCWEYHCSRCLQRFMSYKDRERHMIEVHKKTKPIHSCPECKDTFLSKYTYRVHFATNHAKDSISCSECGKKFPNQRELDKHSVVHTHIKNYKCDVCSKMFARKKNLLQHMWIHSEYKRFECVPCKKKFNQKVSYRTHMKNHHGA
ncbi:gastrula zinc finger protein XlCGF57.1 isoform X14 [Manduca sexta]|uniref:gastrula zinc finger protein XlCGF57.1 isoform X14 n=1 Tax=Manduca sexta TaxID=7130 RepID=UPI00188F821F|nr:gastrula zinc finger protein XlCGF57.1 isoform X14 [Manduca sexta]